MVWQVKQGYWLGLHYVLYCLLPSANYMFKKQREVSCMSRGLESWLCRFHSGLNLGADQTIIVVHELGYRKEVTSTTTSFINRDNFMSCRSS